MMVCIKRLGPKTEAQLSLTKSVPIYDPSIPPEDVACLQYLYSTDMEILCGSIKLNVLARTLARLYGPSVSYPGLRHMIIALFISKSGIRTTSTYPTESGQSHVDIVIRELGQRLSNPIEIDESDIFVAYMLALWSGQTSLTAAEIHVEGVIAIMRHVSHKLGHLFHASPMVPFWALLRDEIFWLIRKSNNFYRMCQDFRDILGPKTIQQRQRYENELRAAIIPTFHPFDAKVFFGRSMHTSVHTMMESAKIINQRYPLQILSQDPPIESVLVELRVEQLLLEQKGYELILELELAPLQYGDYVEDWRMEFTIVHQLHDLLVLNICRLASIALEAPSIQEGLSSPKGIAASASLVSLLRKGRAFFQSGIHGERVFGTGMKIELFGWLMIRSW